MEEMKAWLASIVETGNVRGDQEIILGFAADESRSRRFWERTE